MAGKGSKRRPSSVSSQQIADNWELALGKKETVDNTVLDVYNKDINKLTQDDEKSFDNDN